MRNLNNNNAGNPYEGDLSSSLILRIHKHMVGNGQLFETPFGLRQITYADFTASGRSLDFIEQYMTLQVLPFYANTHTTTSITGRQSTSFREEARDIIAQGVNADPKKDCVLFCGSGCTGAVAKLIAALGIQAARKERAVVFVGPFEHHSNILPWKESLGAQVVMVPEGIDQHVDLDKLEELLIQYRHRSLKIGTFSAASNITGLRSNTDDIATLLHKYGALSFWDYASAAPYVEMDMNPGLKDKKKKHAYKDAIFFSGHKFIGGPNTPGVLVVKKKLLEREVPTQPGGGTVLYVTEDDHHYLDDKIERNEGGTPDVAGSIRLGLAFQLKQQIGTDLIEEKETYNTRYVMSELKKNPNILILGPQQPDMKLPIFSFVVKYAGRFLDYNFVCTLLNDLFGIQTRGGCQCAGPYAQRVLGVSNDNSKRIRRALLRSKDPTIKPGFIRLSFPYFLSTQDVEFMVKCLDFVGTHGWKFMRLYEFSYETGEWMHPSGSRNDTKKISDFDFGTFLLPIQQTESKPVEIDARESYLETANELVKQYLSWNKVDLSGARKCIQNQGELRWCAFDLDDEASSDVLDSSKQVVDPTLYHDSIRKPKSKVRGKGKAFLLRSYIHRLWFSKHEKSTLIKL